MSFRLRRRKKLIKHGARFALPISANKIRTSMYWQIFLSRFNLMDSHTSNWFLAEFSRIYNNNKSDLWQWIHALKKSLKRNQSLYTTTVYAFTPIHLNIFLSNSTYKSIVVKGSCMSTNTNSSYMLHTTTNSELWHENKHNAKHMKE